MSTETSSDADAADTSNRETEPFRCETCKTPFITGDDLRHHVQLTHKGGETKAKVKSRKVSKGKGKGKGKSVKSAKSSVIKKKSKTTAKRKVNPRKNIRSINGRSN